MKKEMKKETGRVDKKRVQQQVIKYLFILVGSVIYAVGFQFFMFPNAIISGGVTGIAMLINHFTHLPVGVMIIVFNIPLFLVAWKHFGPDFLFSSLAGMFLSSIFVDLLAATKIVLTNEPMLACVIGGVVKGAGMGMVYYVGATQGGTDIAAKMIRQKRPYINFGTLLLLMDAVIIAAYALVLGRYDSAMYSIIAMYVVSKVVDLALYGMDMSSLCYIITEDCQELVKVILSGHLRRGVTILEGEGAYSHKQKDILLCVVKRTQVPELRRLVKSIDEKAFFIVTDAKNVFGKGFENIAEVK